MEKPDLTNATYNVIKGCFGDEIYVFDYKTKGYTGFFRDFPIVVQGTTVEEAQENLWNTSYDIFKNFLDK